MWNTYAEYRADPAISQSDLKAFDRNRQLYHETRHLKIWEPDPPNESMIFGNMVERWLLCGDKGDEGIVKIPVTALSAAGQRRGKTWDAWKDRQHPDAVLLTPKEYDEKFFGLERIRANVDSHPLAKDMLSQEVIEESEVHPRFKWTCPHTGMDRKAELDLWLPDERLIVDIKTAADVTPDGFANAAEAFGYAKQAVTYQEKMYADRVLFIVIKNKKPYNVEVHELDEEWLVDAHDWNRDTMQELKRCTDENECIRRRILINQRC